MLCIDILGIAAAVLPLYEGRARIGPVAHHKKPGRCFQAHLQRVQVAVEKVGERYFCRLAAGQGEGQTGEARQSASSLPCSITVTRGRPPCAAG